MKPPNGARDAGARWWLCRDDSDRERMLEMEERIRPVRRRAAVIMTAAILAASPWLGWWPLAFVLSIMAGFAGVDALMGRLKRPELLMFGAWVGSPGGELDSAAVLAESLREAIASTPLGPGVPVSIGIGVCASLRGELFDYDAVFARADEALYQAKHSGRDRVCVADGALVAVPA